MANNNLLNNLRVDLEISPGLQNLMNHHADIAPLATKAGFRKITKEGSKQTKQKIRSLGLVKSGQLAKSIRGSTTNSKSFIGTTLYYAHMVEGGTKPHVIKAKKGKSLFIPGSRVPIKKVRHPGIKGYKFLETTFETMQNSGEVNSLFALGVQEAIERLS
jgi:phage gpG-like protein